MTCDAVCYGEDSCVRICSNCPAHHLDGPDCKKLEESVKDTLFNSRNGKQTRLYQYYQSINLKLCVNTWEKL